jgi:hypothetical protein
MNIFYQNNKRLDGQRGGYFHGIYSSLEADNMLGVVDLTFEALIMSSDTDTKGSSRAPVKVIDVPITFEDEDNMFIDFDA